MPTDRGSKTVRRRADARRNIEAILAAAHQCLCQNPGASIADIAAAAGVGRITLYGHFRSRAALIDAVTTRALAAFDDAMGSVDLTGDPRDALMRLIDATWRLTRSEE